MPKFDFKPGDEAYIVQKDKHSLEGPYCVASIRRGGANGPQALILEGGVEPIVHADPETVFHDREAARLFALSLVDRAINEAKKDLESLEEDRALLLREPKYFVGQTVWAFIRFVDRRVRGPFVVEKIRPQGRNVSYRLKTDLFPFYADETEEDLYPAKDEAKAVALEEAARRVAEAQKSLDKAKEDEKEVING